MNCSFNAKTNRCKKGKTNDPRCETNTITRRCKSKSTRSLSPKKKRPSSQSGSLTPTPIPTATPIPIPTATPILTPIFLVSIKLIARKADAEGSPLKDIDDKINLASHLKKYWSNEKKHLKDFINPSDKPEFKILKANLSGTTIKLLVEPTANYRQKPTIDNIKIEFSDWSLMDTAWEGSGGFWIVIEDDNYIPVAYVDFDKVEVKLVRTKKLETKTKRN